MAGTPADLKLWRDLATKERKGADPEGLVWHTPEGLDVIGAPRVGERSRASGP